MTYQAFVSSTFEDLEKHRKHVIDELRNAGIQVDPMENWTADRDEPKKFSQNRVDGCDLCVLLVAFRRGFVPDGETLSITQLEYEAAKNAGIDVLPFLLDEDAHWKRKYDELDKDPGIREWRTQIEGTHGVEYFDHEPESIKIGGALARWIEKQTKDDDEPTPPPELVPPIYLEGIVTLTGTNSRNPRVGFLSN